VTSEYGIWHIRKRQEISYGLSAAPSARYRDILIEMKCEFCCDALFFEAVRSKQEGGAKTFYSNAKGFAQVPTDALRAAISKRQECVRRI